MPDITPDYKTEIKILLELVIDLYVKQAAIRDVAIHHSDLFSSGDFTVAEKKVWDKVSLDPVIQKLIQKFDLTNLEAGREALKALRE